MNVPLFEKIGPMAHYYGDTVRKFFLAAGVILLVAILRDQEFLSFYLFIGVFGVLLLTVLAGLTNSRTKGVIMADVVTSIIFFLLFEYLAVSAYVQMRHIIEEVFLLRQLLAPLFLIAVYFSTKTYRGVFLNLQ